MSTPTPCRWRKLLNEAVNENMKQNKDSISYCFSTVDTLESSFSAGRPRSRFVVHRGFVNERRPKEERSWSKNSAGDELEGDEGWTGDAMLTTTDVRAPKSQQITAHKDGCPVEIAWWFEPTGEQFRIQGRAYIVSPPGHANAHKGFPAAQLAPSSAGSLKAENFDWESERQRIYRKLSPPLKASFIRPTPGTPLDGKIDPKDFPTTVDYDEEPELVKKALETFALIVIEPYEVDMCKLKVEPNERYVWKKSHGEWKETAVVP
ncbi:uncharacterized protein L969DRAFT_88145 [Mixia osmundae IAM 14324]|uniref:Pyridoxamine 5'-phosphate oxidase Alr4036 family FMN-binding domain-containing protein n=1 Tax=Mixia osmundae (strain CBS 9802 / IAM 14324 / JCM 22182 / KY 12970) TaxID=764103 RepID=G7E135_MIXOS|nr:uncharacterized protein L969DRAFT_88145 [Mixia osmundae IAM 14324]KEI38819.1 hypothetical protein L969DRAFT_88145 [Mixia osmundae IAM 14324]GAA96545.1 hypothetical protein E5Q_03213 [Mixia osmundae IAM 14324]